MQETDTLSRYRDMTKRQALDAIIELINGLPDHRHVLGLCWCFYAFHEVYKDHLDFLKELSMRVRALNGCHGFIGYKWSLDKEGDRLRIEWIKSQPEYKL